MPLPVALQSRLAKRGLLKHVEPGKNRRGAPRGPERDEGRGVRGRGHGGEGVELGVEGRDRRVGGSGGGVGCCVGGAWRGGRGLRSVGVEPRFLRFSLLVGEA